MKRVGSNFRPQCALNRASPAMTFLQTATSTRARCCVSELDRIRRVSGKIGIAQRQKPLIALAKQSAVARGQIRTKVVDGDKLGDEMKAPQTFELRSLKKSGVAKKSLIGPRRSEQ